MPVCAGKKKGALRRPLNDRLNASWNYATAGLVLAAVTRASPFTKKLPT